MVSISKRIATELNAQERAILNSLKASYAAAEAKQRLMEGELKGTTKQLDQIARYIHRDRVIVVELDVVKSKLLHDPGFLGKLSLRTNSGAERIGARIEVPDPG